MRHLVLALLPLLDKPFAIWWLDTRMHTGMADQQASEGACMLHYLRF